MMTENTLPAPESVIMTAQCPVCTFHAHSRGREGGRVPEAVEALVDHVSRNHVGIHQPDGTPLPLYIDMPIRIMCLHKGCSTTFESSPFGQGTINQALEEELPGRVTQMLAHYDQVHTPLFTTMVDVSVEFYGREDTDVPNL